MKNAQAEVEVSFTKTDFSDRKPMSYKIEKNDTVEIITDRILKSISVDIDKSSQYLLADKKDYLPIDDNAWRFCISDESSLSVELINLN